MVVYRFSGLLIQHRSLAVRSAAFVYCLSTSLQWIEEIDVVHACISNHWSKKARAPLNRDVNTIATK